jgi:hypothetical protein
MTAKLQFLLRAPASRPLDDFDAFVQQEVAPAVLGLNPARLKLTLTGKEPPRLSIVPYRRDRLALISIWDENPPEQAAARFRDCLVQAGAAAAYRVSESLPRAYGRDWPDGADTPGLGMLTLFRRKAGLSGEEFLRRWHQGHTPLALTVHPLWNYVRNVVEEPALQGSPPLDAIVEEQFRSAGELLNPIRLFGGPLWMVPNMIRIGLDVKGFIELGTLENYLVRERWIRS